MTIIENGTGGVDQGWHDGPYTVHERKDTYSHFQRVRGMTWCIHNGSGKAIWVGTLSECNTMASKINGCFALWCMIRDTEAEHL